MSLSPFATKLRRFTRDVSSSFPAWLKGASPFLYNKPFLNDDRLISALLSSGSELSWYLSIRAGGSVPRSSRRRVHEASESEGETNVAPGPSDAIKWLRCPLIEILETFSLDH